MIPSSRHRPAQIRTVSWEGLRLHRRARRRNRAVPRSRHSPQAAPPASHTRGRTLSRSTHRTVSAGTDGADPLRRRTRPSSRLMDSWGTSTTTGGSAAGRTAAVRGASFSHWTGASRSRAAMTSHTQYRHRAL